MENKKISVGNEVIRFLVTGVICALADFLVMSLFMRITAPLGVVLQSLISLFAGFMVGVVMNYFLSTFWVFKGVEDQKKTKNKWFIVKFVILSAIAYGLSYGTYELCRIICDSAWGYNINSIGIDYIFTFTFWGDVVFWLYFAAFCLKTLVGLIWNYFTRKYILYKNKNA